MLGVAGLLGAGRTELLEAIFGASPYQPTGTIRLEGRPVRFTHPDQAIKAGIAMTTEDRKTLGLFDQMTVAENITLRRLPELTIGPLVNPRAEKRAVAWSVKELAIKTAGGDVPVTTLSGGNQQKCILARWLLIEPKVLVARRADSRHRRRGQGRDLSVDPPARFRGPRHHHDLERAARAARGLGPDHRPVRRPAGRRDSSRRSHRGSHHARRDVIPRPQAGPTSANADLESDRIEHNGRQSCESSCISMCLSASLCSLPAVAADFPRFQAQEIDPHAGEVCYAVTAADVNGDGKLDVVVVTEDAVIWYENPSWSKQDIVRRRDRPG